MSKYLIFRRRRPALVFLGRESRIHIWASPNPIRTLAPFMAGHNEEPPVRVRPSPERVRDGFGYAWIGFGQVQKGFGQAQKGFGQAQIGFGQAQIGVPKFQKNIVFIDENRPRPKKTLFLSKKTGRTLNETSKNAVFIEKNSPNPQKGAPEPPGNAERADLVFPPAHLLGGAIGVLNAHIVSSLSNLLRRRKHQVRTFRPAERLCGKNFRVRAIFLDENSVF